MALLHSLHRFILYSVKYSLCWMMTGYSSDMRFDSSLTVFHHISRSRHNSDRARGFHYQMLQWLILLKRVLSAGSDCLPIIPKDKSDSDKVWTVPCLNTSDSFVADASVAIPVALNFFLHEGRTCYKSLKNWGTPSRYIHPLSPLLLTGDFT